MSLALAIRKNARSIAATQNTYKQNVAMVNTYVTSVLTSKLPTLSQNPPDWQDFVTAYEQANSDALSWVNNVMARLLDVPSEVQDYNNIISQLLTDAQNQAQILVSDPSNKTALSILDRDLDSLSKQLAIVVTFISGAVTAVQNFGDTLPDMATQLQTIATASAQAANADQAQIDQLNADIQSLQAEIKSLTAAIIALGIADGVALTIGVVATIALWPVGALVWFVMGPAVAVATTYIALDGLKITADKNKIAADESAITGLTADVATLQVLTTNYANMASETQQIETALQGVLQEWQTLESEINAAISDLKAAIADAGSSNFTAVLNEVNDAVTEWNAAYNQAGALTLDLQVNNAQLQLGMSSADVQAALSSGQTVNIIQYYNQIQSSKSIAA
ncbi:hypothetical protein QN219_31515 [Sinorhizobium sp. 7-81]|uniref:hypothetical protein n=1 Tax=Sinorhizobium sp. 8-89 TaxID=3049089 RepID=UPI0024C2A3E7|nr:hypothetical protein [Sinorhizobium sp. 8-89]MDK1494469.1 hypothetical protein [Sinorhizobium sp. 8-89]